MGKENEIWRKRFCVPCRVQKFLKEEEDFVRVPFEEIWIFGGEFFKGFWKDS